MTKVGKALYGLRKQTVEPVFGITKETIGFRLFHLRSDPQVETECTLANFACNIKRLFNLVGGATLHQKAKIRH